MTALKLTAHNYILEIDSYKPGKESIKGQEAIKLSSNENALGSSPQALEAYNKHDSKVMRYADGSCLELRTAIGKDNNINKDNIVCGAGSDELIALLTSSFAKEGDEIIYSQYGFLMYPISAKRIGAKPVKIAEKNFKADIKGIISAINEKTKIIFIANPNNPTGSYLNKEEIEELVAKTPKNILIVLDHAYQEFVEEIDYPNAINLVERNENIVVTRTFSKIYGLASLRIGWCYSSEYVADVLNKTRGPFNVGGPAQVAAIAAIEDKEFSKKSKDHNKKWLQILSEEISKIDKIKVHPSVANFILIDFGNENACQNANKTLLEEGIILRETKAYGLQNCLRMTVGTEEENMKTIKILKNL